MNESALRDVDRWKDKIEVRLDNRQVFFLFFGSAVVACMLFVLGVIVGKRIESRGRADALEVQDPLAALDRAHQPPMVAGPVEPPAELTFPKALATNAGKSATTMHASASVASGKPTAPKPIAVAAAPKTLALVTPKPIAVAPKPVVVAPKPVGDLAKTKGKYTLQLSAFPTREEADAFAKRFDGTFIIPTEVPGKGTWFRVRCGNFASYQEATAAKATFEKQNKVIALVAGR
jgi:septal ring-binding cell division protein DamX